MRRARPAPVVAPLRPVPAGRGGGRSGASLVELCVAMLLLAIVFAGWVRMNNIQAVNKESLRYAAIEKAAGMLEAIEADDIPGKRSKQNGMYLRIGDDGAVSQVKESPETAVMPLLGEEVPIGYQIRVAQGVVEGSRWGDESLWLVCDLFDFYGERQAGAQPFTSLHVFSRY